MAHYFYILLIKEYDFKLADSCKILMLSIYGMYYEYTKLIYTWDPLILLYIMQARTL